MRRWTLILIALVLALAALTACGSPSHSAPKPHLWLSSPVAPKPAPKPRRHHPGPHARLVSLVSFSPTGYAITLNWGTIPFPGVTGYNMSVNGTQVGTPTASPYTFTNLACGTTYTLGVQAHDSGAGVSQVYSTSYTTPGCSGSAPVNTVQPYFTASTVSNTDGTCSAGCAIQGQQLSVTPGLWSNSPSFSYQWQDCTTSPGASSGIQVPTGGGNYAMSLPTTGSCSNATGTGATTATYTVGALDVGHSLTVNVTASTGSGSASTTPSGSCHTGLMTTSVPAAVQSAWGGVPASTFFNNGQPGCSPISAVVGTGQFGTSTSGEHFCTNAPITCGFADIGNTGPPVGTILYAVPGTCTSPSGPGAGCGNTGSGWTYSGGNFSFSAGATLQNISTVLGSGHTIHVTVNNVTIQDSQIACAGSNNFAIQPNGGTNVTIAFNDLTGEGTSPGQGCDQAVSDGNGGSTTVSIHNNNIWYCAACFNNFFDGTWSTYSNYVHDFAFSDPGSGNHFDGVQLEGNDTHNQSPWLFANNTDLMDYYQTSPIIFSTDNAQANTNRQVIHNLVAGGDFDIYGGMGISHPTTNSTFQNNAFSSIYFGAASSGSADGGGSFGPVSQWGGGTGDVKSGNIWDDNGSTSGLT